MTQRQLSTLGVWTSDELPRFQTVLSAMGRPRLEPPGGTSPDSELRAAEISHDGENRKDAGLTMKPLWIGSKLLTNLFRYRRKADTFFVSGNCRGRGETASKEGAGQSCQCRIGRRSRRPSRLRRREPALSSVEHDDFERGFCTGRRSNS
jgi:hypothetical protein